MVMPFLPDVALASLGSTITAGMDETATFSAEMIQGNDDATTSSLGWIQQGDPWEALLLAPSAKELEKAAALGVVIQWTVKLPIAALVKRDMQAMIRGEDEERGAWQRLVKVTADLGLTTRMHRLIAAVDADLNQ